MRRGAPRARLRRPATSCPPARCAERAVDHRGQEPLMKERPSEPLRGEAAWRAAKDAIAKRNDAARARGAAERAAYEEMRAEHRRTAARREAASRPAPSRPSGNGA